ncbi:hypothetical protein MT1_3672 [Pseudomonas sp. MT-1]|nr:hypothetical protein MT1_3672 [Pseudomonas sp. MT-1]
MHVNQLEATTDDACITKLGAHLLGRGTGSHIVVLWLQIEQQVADASTHDIRLVAGMLEPLDDTDGVPAEIVAVQRMLPAGQYFGGATRMRESAQG